MLASILLVACAQQPSASNHPDDRYKGMVKMVDTTSGHHRLLVHSFGSPPELLRKDVIKACGFALDLKVKGKADPIYTMSMGEIDPFVIIDFSKFSEGLLNLTTCTWDPRTPFPEDTPFIRKTLTIQSDGGIEVTDRILLPAEDGDQQRIDSLVAAILQANQKNGHLAFDEIRDQLAHLRNIAINHPNEVLGQIRKLPNLRGDCAGQLMKTGFIDEVEEIKEVLNTAQEGQ